MTDKPVRIQRQRTKGWKMPPNTVYVGRPSRWGNHNDANVVGADLAVRLFRHDIERGAAGWPGIGKPLTHEMIRAELAGKNLACWCPIGCPCHADVLLEIANHDR
jgi:hypothetical protein